MRTLALATSLLVAATLIGEPAADLSEFLKAGCKLVGASEDQKLSCAESTSALLRSCNSLKSVPAELSPLPHSNTLLLCYFESAADAVGSDQATKYEGCGLLQLYSKYIVATERGFVDVPNAMEFAKVFAPVDSPAKALAFAVGLTRSTAKYDVTIPQGYVSSVDRFQPTHVIEVQDGYVVNLFGYDCGGCGPHYYYEIEYFVSRQGYLTERNRTNLYRNPKEDNMCWD